MRVEVDDDDDDDDDSKLVTSSLRIRRLRFTDNRSIEVRTN